MSERSYTRPEFERELDQVAKWSNYGDNANPKTAKNRLLAWYDEVIYDLGQVGALREALARATNEKVDAEVRANEAEATIRSLEKQLSAKRVKEEDDE
jgi:hypothetical protein